MGKWILYFIQEAGTKAVKIGITTDIHNRIQTLQVGCPYKFTLLAAKWSTREEEQALHYHFADSRLQGEWFSLTPELEELITTSSTSLDQEYRAALGKRCGCGRISLDIKQIEEHQYQAFCRKCSMEHDGRMTTLLDFNKQRPRIVKLTECTICRETKKGVRKGRCHKCDEYYRRHGTERPPSLDEPVRRIRPCAHCKETKKIAGKMLCGKCYQHQLRHGVPHPLK